MGTIVHAAKITHVPSIWMSHTMEKFKGIRQAAIDGFHAMRAEAERAGAETFIIFDTHWIVNQGFHVNAKPRHAGVFTSPELPHMLSDLAFDHRGDPELGQVMAECVRAAGLRAIAHQVDSLGCDYGTLVPMHFMNEGDFARVLPVAANQFASIDEGRRMGAAVAEAIGRIDRKVSILASGSLSHAFWPNAISEQGLNTVNGEFNRQMDLRVLDLWEQGRWTEFLAMLPDYAVLCRGECAMIDTAMLFGALGWDEYAGSITVHTPYFGSSGTGQVNISLTPPASTIMQ